MFYENILKTIWNDLQKAVYDGWQNVPKGVKSTNKNLLFKT